MPAAANRNPAIPTALQGIGPANTAEAVTPSDTVDLVNVSRALWIGAAGNVNVIMAGSQGDGSGSTVVFVGVAAGTLLPIRVTRVKATSTTATSIVAVS